MLVYMVYRLPDLYESDSGYIWYIGCVTSMKAIQAPVILIIKRIIQLGQAMIKNLMISQLSLITLQNWSSKKNYKKEFD